MEIKIQSIGYTESRGAAKSCEARYCSEQGGKPVCSSPWKHSVRRENK